MLLRRTIHKTKNFFHKRLQNLKSLLFGGYHKLPKAPPPLKAFPSSNRIPKMQQLDNFYREFSEQWEPDQDELMDRKKNNIIAKGAMREGNASHRSFMNHAEQSVVKTTQERRGKEEKKTSSCHERKRGVFFPKSANERGYVLAEKMKELEMMDGYDMDHVLDIEEVLYHYSRLTCSVYLDIVDKFFMDMYSEFYLPQPSASVKNSMRRLHSVKL